MALASLKTRTNGDEVMKDLADYLRLVVTVALPRAENKLIDQAKTAGLAQINAIYRIGPRAFDKYVTLKRASNGDLEAELTVRGRGLPLQLFSPLKTKKGVSVLIKGRRVLIPHAFLATMKSGHVGVFARGAYGGKGKIVPTGETFGRFAFGKKRFAINELFTFAAPDAFSNPDVVDAMQKRVADQASAVIEHEIAFATGG